MPVPHTSPSPSFDRPRQKLVAMCNISTPYYAACAHYAAAQVTAYCIKGLVQKGYSRGCDEKRDGGVENAGGLCPKCCRRKGSVDSGVSTMSTSTCSSSSGSMKQTQAHSRGSSGSSGGSSRPASASSRAGHISRAEAADYARSLLACMPASIPTVRRNASGVGLPPVSMEAATDVQVYGTSGSEGNLFERERKASNMHWRCFDGRAWAA